MRACVCVCERERERMCKVGGSGDMGGGGVTQWCCATSDCR